MSDDATILEQNWIKSEYRKVFDGNAADRHVYGIPDPKTGLIIYVGKTTNPEDRLNYHIRHLEPLRAMRDAPNCEFKLYVFERVRPQHWDGSIETHWVLKCLSHGYKLLNAAFPTALKPDEREWLDEIVDAQNWVHRGYSFLPKYGGES